MNHTQSLIQISIDQDISIYLKLSPQQTLPLDNPSLNHYNIPQYQNLNEQYNQSLKIQQISQYNLKDNDSHMFVLPNFFPQFTNNSSQSTNLTQQISANQSGQNISNQQEQSINHSQESQFSQIMEQNQNQVTVNSQSANNMPKFLIGVLKSIIKQISFDCFYVVEIYKICKIQQIQECFKYLVNVFLNLSSKQGIRQHIRMIFNKASKQQKLNISKKKNKKRKRISKAETNYRKNTKNFQIQILNEAKQIFRTTLCRKMTQHWINQCANSKKFKQSKRNILFKQYIVYFKMQLQSGHISQSTRQKKESTHLLQQ